MDEALKGAQDLIDNGILGVHVLTPTGTAVFINKFSIEMRAPAVEFTDINQISRVTYISSAAEKMLGFRCFHTCCNVAVFSCLETAHLALRIFTDKLAVRAVMVQTAMRFPTVGS